MNGDGFGLGSVVLVGLGCAALGYLSGVDAEVLREPESETKPPGRIHRSAKWLKTRWAQKKAEWKAGKKSTPPTTVTADTIRQCAEAAKKHGINSELVEAVLQQCATMEEGVPGGEQPGWDFEKLAELVKESESKKTKKK